MQPSSAIQDHRQANIRDLLLYALAATSGSVDAISFLALGKVFSSFMSGNIIFLGLRAVSIDAPGVVSILVAMASWAAGVYVSMRIINQPVGRSVWPRRVTAALGVSLIAQAVFVMVWALSKGQPSTDAAHVLLGSWAFAMGIQSDAVRTLHIEGVFTTAVTGTVLLFVREFMNRPAHLAETRRHAGVLISLLIGAAAGGHLLSHAHMAAPALPFLITTAVVATAALVFRKPGPGDEVEKSEHVYRTVSIDSKPRRYGQTITVGPHCFDSDEPTEYGGNDAGPTAVELLLAALGACAATTAQMAAEQRHWPRPQVHVGLSHAKVPAGSHAQSDPHRAAIDEIDLAVSFSGDLPEDQQQTLFEIANRCPVHRMLVSPIQISPRLLISTSPQRS